MNGVDTIKKVFTEFTPVDHFLQIAVGSTNQAYVYGDMCVAPYADDAASLKNGKKFRLEVIREISDLLRCLSRRQQAVVG